MRRSKKKDYLDLEEINVTLDKLIENTNTEMDLSVLEGKLDVEKIRKIATERVTIKRIRNILNSIVEENKEENNNE